MGILSRSLGIQALSVEDPSQPLLPGSVMMESLGLGRSDAGVLVNEAQAMRITTAQVCVKIISEDLASNNHEIFQQMPDASMRLATEHRLWRLIHDEPNPNMCAAVFWGAVGASAVGWGNGYSWIKRDRAARVVSLVPLKSGLTSPVKVNGELMYGTTQTDSGQTAFIDPANILHIPGLTFDGIIGLNPIRTCKNAFGLALAAEKFGALLFGNGARASGVLTHPGVLDPEAYENLKKSVHERSTGNNALSPMILEEGLKWEQISINPNDAQFLATRQFQRTEIAGLWRVPLHLLGDLTRATNNNIEHQSLDYVRYCLRPWAVRIEQEVNRKLLGGPYSMEHIQASIAISERVDTIGNDLRKVDRDQAIAEFPVDNAVEKEKNAKLHSRAFSKYIRNGMEQMDADERQFMQRQFLPNAPGAVQNAQSTTTTQGGYLIPQGFSAELEEAKKWFGGIAGNVGKFTTATGNPWPWPTLNDTANKGRIIGQNVQVTETDLAFGQVTFNAYIGSSDLILIPLALMEDSYFNLDQLARAIDIPAV